jgi:4-amino-4-deoxy-L-arabinose transferase-like glycosyltransferase
VREPAKQAFSIVAAFAIALVVLAPGIAAPFQKDAEPQSAQWIVDIVDHGNWLLPRDYYDFVERKPPLFYWLSALATKLSGGHVDEARARTVSLIAGAMLAATVMAWSVSNLGAAQGWLAFFFLLGTYGFASRATTALTDMLMTFLLISAYCVVWPAVEGETSWQRTAVAGVISGLAILTKGPVAIVLLALAVFIYLLLIRSNPLRFVSSGWPWAMIAIAVTIAAGWYVPAFLAGRGSGVGEIFVDENFGHFMPASLGGTGEAARPVYYIAMRLLGGALPLTLLFPALAVAFANGRFSASLQRPILYQAAMAIAVVILFSAASAKRDDYILPALPSLAILFAALFVEGLQQTPARTSYAAIARDLIAVVIALTMLVGIIGVFAYFRAAAGPASFKFQMNSSDASYASIFVRGLTSLKAPFLVFGAVVIIGACSVCADVWRGRAMTTGGGLALLCLAGTLLWTAILRPVEARSRSLDTFAREVRARVGSDPIYTVYDDPGFSWYYGRGVPALPRSVAGPGPTLSGRHSYLVARPHDLVRLPPLIQRNLEVAFRSNVLDGDGAPVLYVLKAP